MTDFPSVPLTSSNSSDMMLDSDSVQSSRIHIRINFTIIVSFRERCPGRGLAGLVSFLLGFLGLREVVVAVGLEHDFAEVFPLQVVVVSLLLNHFLMAF